MSSSPGSNDALEIDPVESREHPGVVAAHDAEADDPGAERSRARLGDGVDSVDDRVQLVLR